MSELTSEHLDDFTLLRYVAGDLSEAERRSAARHLSECNACTGVEREIVQLDRELRALSDSDVDALRSGAGKSTLRRGDPFRARPEIQEPVRRRGSARRIAEKAVAASERARPVSEGLLRAVRGGRVRAALAELSLEDASHRYGLLYALQSSGAMIAESPLGSLRFAEEALDVLRRAVFAPAAEHEAEAMVPRLVLRGQAHTLAGQACIWTRELERARVHLELAYRSFAGGGDEINLAGVELAESQRRSFAGKPVEGLLLAERAGATYESFGLKDLWAKTRVACGLALFELDRQEEAIGAYREALPFFERSGLWSNYVGTLNSLATSFARAGRLEEARREYARALR